MCIPPFLRLPCTDCGIRTAVCWLPCGDCRVLTAVRRWSPSDHTVITGCHHRTFGDAFDTFGWWAGGVFARAGSVRVRIPLSIPLPFLYDRGSIHSYPIHSSSRMCDEQHSQAAVLSLCRQCVGKHSALQALQAASSSRNYNTATAISSHSLNLKWKERNWRMSRRLFVLAASLYRKFIKQPNGSAGRNSGEDWHSSRLSESI